VTQLTKKLTEVKTTVCFFRGPTPCKILRTCLPTFRRSKMSPCSGLKMEPLCWFKTLVSTYEFTRRYDQEESHFSLLCSQGSVTRRTVCKVNLSHIHPPYIFKIRLNIIIASIFQPVHTPFILLSKLQYSFVIYSMRSTSPALPNFIIPNNIL
jgi:hypothetical protein